MYVIQSNTYCNVIVDTTRSAASAGPRKQIRNKDRKRAEHTHTRSPARRCSQNLLKNAHSANILIEVSRWVCFLPRPSWEMTEPCALEPPETTDEAEFDMALSDAVENDVEATTAKRCRHQGPSPVVTCAANLSCAFLISFPGQTLYQLF